jgi:hypothetical protein
MEFKNQFKILLKDDLLHTCIFLIIFIYVFTIGFAKNNLLMISIGLFFAGFCLAWLVTGGRKDEI